MSHIPLATDLIPNSKIKYRKAIPFWRPKNQAAVFSGKIQIQPSGSLKYRCDPKVKSGENLSVIGSSKWKDYSIEVRFKFLTHSLKPPEGGVILYFFFKNAKNYYSLHLAIFKHKLEFIKRQKGAWSSMVGYTYELETTKEYRVKICSRNGNHRCEIDGSNILSFQDKAFSCGAIGIGVKYVDAEFNRLSILFH